MSSFTWYSRLVTWLGALVLVLQAVLGQTPGPLTFVAVLALGAGFAGFLVGLAFVDRPLTAAIEAGTDQLPQPAVDMEPGNSTYSPDGGPSKP